MFWTCFALLFNIHCSIKPEFKTVSTIQTTHFTYLPTLVDISHKSAFKMSSNLSLLIETSQVVPCPPGTLRRFHEAVTLLESLRDLFVKHNATHCMAEEESFASERNPKQLYFCFVNKLSQICDTTRGGEGATITAFAVRQSGTVQYLLASNRRDASELTVVRSFVVDILSTLGAASDEVVAEADHQSDIFQHLLRKILIFNRPRIRYYIKELDENLEFCIEKAREEGTDTGKFFVVALISLRHVGIC